MSVRLFVGSLPFDATEAELREHFSEVGPICFISLPRDRETNKPRGFAFVEYENPAHAAEALRRFNGQPFKNRLLSVNEARARESRPPITGGTRPPQFRPQRQFEPALEDGSSREDKPARNFGPDAAPRRRTRKRPSRGVRTAGGPKRSISEKVGGRFFGVDDESADADGEEFDGRLAGEESDEIAGDGGDIASSSPDGNNSVDGDERE